MIKSQDIRRPARAAELLGLDMSQEAEVATPCNETRYETQAWKCREWSAEDYLKSPTVEGTMGEDVF